jgi:diguanylate cyclase (GGDEF)-like protein/PAS domain S-box-containing protein
VRRGEELKHYRPHILVVVALAVVLLSGWHGTFRNALADLRFRWQQREASGSVVVVGIDARSIEAIGIWPWPRKLHAQLLTRLQEAGAGDIAFDIDFSAPSDAVSDREFVTALKSAAGSVILPSFKQPGAVAGDPQSLHINRPLKPFADQSWAAVVNVEVEPDGRIRRYPLGERLGGEFLPSMAAVLAGQFNKADASLLIDFGIRAGSIPTISYVDVLRGDAAALAMLKDRKVVIGGTALELGDRFSVPNGAVISGPMLQALAAESILQGRSLRWTSDVVTLAATFSLILLMMFAWRRLTAGGRVIVLFGMAFAVETAALLLQSKWPVILDTSLLYTAIAAYLAAIALDEIDFRGLLGHIAENRFQRIAMSLGDGLVCTDKDHLITIWNPGAAVIFGYESEEMIGKPFDVICAGGAASAASLFAAGESVRPAFLSPGGVLMEFQGRRKTGDVFPVETCISGWQGTDGLQYGAVLRDISVRKREAERIRYLAEHDSLTGLANRTTLHSSLSAMISQAGASQKIALLVVGLDGFQQINDMLGHKAGDHVLRAVSEQLMLEVDGEGVVARLSGDEFAIAMPCTAISGEVAKFADHVAHAFDKPLLADGRVHRVKVSIGVAVYPHDGGHAEELLSNSHLAFCRAKATRRGGHVMFRSSIRQEIETRLTLEAELALALEREEFELFYQPQVKLVDGSLIGVEALIRWRHPERGLVSPAQFIPVVNTSSISDRVATWVLETACEQARRWELAGHGIRVGINLSPSQIASGDLAQSVADALAVSRLTPSLLELEVTEDVLLLDEKRVLDTFRRISDLGVRIVFDDFGTGYASLSYLKKFPLDGLKIDRSFVLDLLTDHDDAAIVGSTVGLAHQLGMSVIAEGIESRAIADKLMTMGCEEGQGYFFGKPMPARDFENRLMVVQDTALAG